MKLAHFKSSFGIDLVRIKSEILCWGMRISNDAFDNVIKLYPLIADETFVHAAHFVLDGKVIVNPCIPEEYSSKSPYELRVKKRKFLLYKREKPQCYVEVIRAPQWYSKRTSDGTKMSDVLRLHGYSVLADTRYTRCDFYTSGKGCLFCSFPSDTTNENTKITQIKETIKVALEENPRYSMGLSEGARNTPDKGAVYLSKIVSSIREVDDNIPISVELVPPDEDKYIDLLIDSGASAIIMNLEFYEESIRKIFCPGKLSITPKRYFEAFLCAVGRLGRGNVSSVLIAGIESIESTLQGAKKMVELGVIPTIIPFKPYDNCYLKKFRLTPPSDLETIARYVGRLLRNNSLNPMMQDGCTGCGGCSLENECFLSMRNKDYCISSYNHL